MRREGDRSTDRKIDKTQYMNQGPRKYGRFQAERMPRGAEMCQGTATQVVFLMRPFRDSVFCNPFTLFLAR